MVAAIGSESISHQNEIPLLPPICEPVTCEMKIKILLKGGQMQNSFRFKLTHTLRMQTCTHLGFDENWGRLSPCDLWNVPLSFDSRAPNFKASRFKPRVVTAYLCDMPSHIIHGWTIQGLLHWMEGLKSAFQMREKILSSAWWWPQWNVGYLLELLVIRPFSIKWFVLEYHIMGLNANTKNTLNIALNKSCFQYFGKCS